MSNVEVKCPNCSKMTTIGRLVCQHCGQKLKGITPADLRKGGKRGHRGTGSAAAGANALGSLVKFLIAVAIIGAVLLMVWPAENVGTAGAEAEMLSIEKKIQILHECIENNKQIKQVVTEQEVNAYFAKLFSDNAEATEGGGLAMGIEGMGVDIRADKVLVVLSSKAGPVNLTWECGFVPKVTGGIVSPEYTDARIGHLPMFGPLKGFVGKKIGGLFGDMPMEKKIWINLAEDPVLSDGQVELKTLITQ